MLLHGYLVKFVTVSYAILLKDRAVSRQGEIRLFRKLDELLLLLTSNSFGCLHRIIDVRSSYPEGLPTGGRKRSIAGEQVSPLLSYIFQL